MDFGFEYHQLFEDLLQMTIDLENNLVGRFGGGMNTGTLVRMVEDINYVNDKASATPKLPKNYVPPLPAFSASDIDVR